MKFKVKHILITIITILAVFMVGKYVLDTLFRDMCGNDIIQKTKGCLSSIAIFNKRAPFLNKDERSCY
ncbi:hypothetical protein CJ195_26010 [Bacillus sp. UMB0899]|nr:hypothetical protein CJ195_26010 [Bacillus sp. UMB0899]